MGSRRRGWRAKIAKYLALAIAVILLATSLPVLALRWVNPWTSAFMIATRTQALLHADFQFSNAYDWVDLEAISPQAAIAVIASEDQQFPFHAGFDFKSIREAVRSNARGKHVRGASTISQQVAKNLFLWSGRSYFRKGLEAYFTLLIEWLWPKERILEMYMNVAELGPGIYGVQAASWRYFKKPALRLSRSQAATLAAVLPNPNIYHVERPSPFVIRRRDWILGQMRALGGPAYLEEIEPVAPGS